MKWKKLSLPLLFCSLMSFINIINNNVLLTNTYYFKLLVVWMVTFFYLLFVWYSNEFLLERYALRHKQPKKMEVITSYLAMNVALVAFIIFINYQVLNLPRLIHGEKSIVWFFALRIFIAASIIIVIQNTLKSLEEKEAIKLVNEQLRNENLQARFETLKQQVNPHFLFNALGTLRIMIREDDQHAEEFVLKLSGIYRELLNKKDLIYITLEEELKFLNDYLFLMQSRFQDMIHVEISLHPDGASYLLPTFSLQMLMENCIKHNIISASKPLLVRFWQDSPDEIFVENNLQPKWQNSGTTGVGIANLRNRYELLRIENGIVVNQTATRFSVTLKLWRS